MALLNSQWQPSDPTGAVAAYLNGVRSGQALGQIVEEAQQQKLKRDAAEQSMALQLLQESRLARADQLRQHYADARDIRATSLARDRLHSNDFTPIPLPDETATAATTATQAPAVADSTTPGDMLNWSANQGVASALPAAPSLDGGDVALSLAQASPFRKTSDFAGVAPDASDNFGDVNSGDILASASEFGGDRSGVVSQENVDSNGMPAGGPADKSLTLFPDNPAAPTPTDAASQVLSRESIARINFAGEHGGKKSADAQMARELAQVAKPTKGEPGAGDTYAYDADTHLYRNQDGAYFRKTDLGGGKFRYASVVPQAGASDESFKRIASFPKEGVFRINPDDPAEVYVEKFTTKGTSYYAPVQPKVQKFGDKPYVVTYDGELQPIEINNDKPIPSQTQKAYMDLKRKQVLNQQLLTDSQKSNDADGVETATKGLRTVSEQIDLLQTMNPRLRDVATDKTPSPAASAASPAVAAATKWKVDPKTGIKWEVDTVSGKLTGKYVPPS